MTSRRSLGRSILLLPVILTALTYALDTEETHCCLPMNWHSQMVEINNKLLTFVPSGDKESEPTKSMYFTVHVNYVKHKFELRSSGGGSIVFTGGHMWAIDANAKVRKMNAVPPGYRPSGGLAPFFFRCLTAQNGFARLNETHYRMTEPDKTRVGRRLNLTSVTDVHVFPLPTSRSNCYLREFSFTSTYPKVIPQRGLAFVRDTDTWSVGSRTELNPEEPASLSPPLQVLDPPLVRAGEAEQAAPHGPRAMD